MRQLVTIKPITELRPIENADAIECAIIDGGWPVVVKKGEFQVGESGVYFEIDSFLPLTDERYSFLANKSVRWEGNDGMRIRTIRLRGQISQGLILPLSLYPELINVTPETDIAELLGIEKWERPISGQLAGNAKGNFPSFIHKTDQERCQNLVRDIFEKHINEYYEITIKLDGSSFTGYYFDGELGICSRNLELKIDEDNKDNSFVRMFSNSKLDQVLLSYSKNIAVQGELMGPNIQGNREKFETTQLFVFDIFLIDEKRYAKPDERKSIYNDLVGLGFTGNHVPIISEKSQVSATNLVDLLVFAEGSSINHKIREGLVYKSHDSDFTFKTISNTFLLKED